MLGSIISAATSLFNANRQEKLQKEFAQNSLSWKAADAERAGISKVFAMGAPAVSYAPVSIGSAGAELGNAANSALSQISGQGTGAGSTTTGKVGGTAAAIQAAQLDGLRIDNDIKRAELSSKLNIATQPGAGHTMDRDTLPGPEGLKLKKEIAPSGYGANKEFGTSPEVSMYRTKSGFAPQIPQQLQEAFESDALSRWQWNIRNKIGPFVDMAGMGTPPHAPPDGSYWTYDPAMGQYLLVKRGSSHNEYGPPTRHHLWEGMMQKLRR